MECIYINLDAQEARKRFLEENFAANRIDGWRLTRLPATDTAQIRRENVKGILREAEKACFFSHRKAVRLGLGMPGHVMILEDDALFGPQSCDSIQGAIDTFPENEWDLLFTDVIVLHVHLMARFLSLRRELAQTGEQMLINLNEIPFTGCTAYVVNRNFKQQLSGLLEESAELNVPIDLYLRDLIYKSKIRAKVTFPFVTSISNLAEQSQSTPKNPDDLSDVALNAFRRFIWLHRDLDQAMERVGKIDPALIDAETHAFSKIAMAALSTVLAEK